MKYLYLNVPPTNEIICPLESILLNKHFYYGNFDDIIHFDEIIHTMPMGI